LSLPVREVQVVDLVAPEDLMPGDNLRSREPQLAELVESIKAFGVLEPLIVAADAGQREGQYTIVAGSRRWAAAKLAGLDKVPVIVRELTAAERVEVALIENLQREDLAPLEEARAYERLVEVHRSTRQIAAKVGRAQSHIVKRLSLLELVAELQAALDSGGITVTQAQEIAKLPAHLQPRIFEARFDAMTAAQAVTVIAKEAARTGDTIVAPSPPAPNPPEKPAADAPVAAGASPAVYAANVPSEAVDRRLDRLAASPAPYSELELHEAMRVVLSSLPGPVLEEAAERLLTSTELLATEPAEAFVRYLATASGAELDRAMIACAEIV
jgi:ParB/RepB/Spo0J family partition protein